MGRGWKGRGQSVDGGLRGGSPSLGWTNCLGCLFLWSVTSPRGGGSLVCVNVCGCGCLYICMWTTISLRGGCPMLESTSVYETVGLCGCQFVGYTFAAQGGV